jgi:BirA family biotin operon repressor/biotin-[acetyl-CoA-carboxylase] ligase
MSFPAQLLHRLAAARAAEDGAPAYVSGAALAADFNVTRSAVWKTVGQLRAMGTEIEAITHRGYRLVQPSSPLATGGVLQHLPAGVHACLRDGRCEPLLESTNSALLARGSPPAGQFDFLTAEYQSAGRGRRGRNWLAAPGGAVCLSWSWSFEGLAAQLGALSLAVGVASLRALASLGVNGIQLKWPNDLVTARGKLGGILIEMRSEAAGPVQVVVGLGLNVALGEQARAEVRQQGNAATDLTELSGSHPPTRERIVAALLTHGVAAMQEFSRSGLASFLGEYRAADALTGRAVQVTGGNDPVQGTAQGIDADGALKVEHQGQIHRIIAGEVSVRGA